jgi:hypothetical protein
MSKEKEYLSDYTEIYKCTQCDWFDKSRLHITSICPKCGNNVLPAIGRFKIKETKNWLSTDKEIIGFEFFKWHC